MQQLLCGSLFLLLLTGCGPTMVTLSGTVTVNGQPLEKGVIDFAPLDKAQVSPAANIVNGRYQLKLATGPKRVSISAPVVIDRRPQHNGPGALMDEITKESLPEKYHAKSELTFDVTATTTEKSWNLVVP